MLVEITNPNILTNHYQKLYFKPPKEAKPYQDQTQHILSTKKNVKNSSSDNFNYLPNNISSQLIVKKLAKRSQKAFRFTDGKNKQAEKRLDLELNLLEKDYAYEDSNWLRDYTNIKKSVKEVLKFSSSYDELTSKSSKFNKNSSRPKTSYSLKSSNYAGSSFLTRSPSQKLDNSNQSSIFQSLKSYKSMIGFKNDKSKDDLENFSFKKLHNCRAMTANTIYRETKSVSYNLSDDENDDVKNDQDLNSNLLEEILIENKSVRRPLKSKASARDIIIQIKSLENKCNFCREQNKINFKLYDRNVRYGEPAPKNKMFKQLKVLSQLESIIK
ncbi:unnamed protein product [Brachionus calyciflorus]|uniref:Uncharacterized protein n=1 Tax=Brachionus calyciflorus TaxID=104777 RepID=A0A814MI77_9BILA|nr:unnamed protein product [Brachionus calyciflorus]